MCIERTITFSLIVTNIFSILIQQNINNSIFDCLYAMLNMTSGIFALDQAYYEYDFPIMHQHKENIS